MLIVYIDDCINDCIIVSEYPFNTLEKFGSKHNYSLKDISKPLSDHVSWGLRLALSLSTESIHMAYYCSIIQNIG